MLFYRVEKKKFPDSGHRVEEFDILTDNNINNKILKSISINKELLTFEKYQYIDTFQKYIKFL